MVTRTFTLSNTGDQSASISASAITSESGAYNEAPFFVELSDSEVRVRIKIIVFRTCFGLGE